MIPQEILQDRVTCSYAYLDFMAAEKYHAAATCARVMLEEFGDVIRHHEMMFTINVRRENMAAALENCNEILSYGKLKGVEVAEYAGYRESVLAWLRKTRLFLAAQFWDEVMEDVSEAPKRYATIPLVLAGEAHYHENRQSGGMYLVFYIRGKADKRVACSLAPCELPFLSGVSFPHRVAVRGRFLSASENLVLLHPCYYLSAYDVPWQ